jgi:diguanylate cyclase (GGDEF)-like protein
MRLRTFILATSALVAILFFGGTYVVLDRLFERAITREATQSSRLMAQVTFNSMYELMSTAWNRAQLESFLASMQRATSESPTNVRILRGKPVEEVFGVIAQDMPDDVLRQALLDGEVRQSQHDTLIRYVFPLRAEQKCLSCHTNAAVGTVLGVIDVSHDIGPQLTASRADFLKLAAWALPAALLLALFAVWHVRLRLERPVTTLTDSIRHISGVSDLRHVDIAHRPTGLTEFDAMFAAFNSLIGRLRSVAVDKGILEFEIGLLEKFVITSDVVRDWREYVIQLLLDINQVVSAHVLFSIFKIDDELFDLEVFWTRTPAPETKAMVERYITEAIKAHPHFGETGEIRIHHHTGRDTEAGPITLTTEELKLQVKSFLVETPKIGGIVGIGVQAEMMGDATLRLVMDSVLSTLLNVVGSVKAIYKYTRDLEYYATRDPLTDLFNQRMFWELLTYERLRAQRHNYSFALLVLDLDNFKLVNDGYGHSFGDTFLQQFALAVRGALRTGDILARYGGDEFTVILPEADLAQARDVAERILAAAEMMDVEAPDGSRKGGATSIGIGIYPTHADEVRDLFLFADNMMYKAKAEGKQRVGIPSDQDVIEVFQNITQKSVLILKALEDKRVIPFFQPIVDVKTHEITAYEVLSRIELDGRIVGAGEFVEIAEKIGVIHRLDTLVMERALEVVAAGGHRGQIFLNLSPRALVLSEFTRNLSAIVAASGIAPERIVLEITERDTIRNFAMLENFLNDLKFEGFNLAIDDFGSGFSSFHYLRRFPIDVLKIEGDFIVNMLHDAKDRALVHSMQSLATELGIRTVAEFVEDDTVLSEVVALGIDLAQGYHLGRPAPQLLPGNIWLPPNAKS